MKDKYTSYVLAGILVAAFGGGAIHYYSAGVCSQPHQPSTPTVQTTQPGNPLIDSGRITNQ